MTQFRRRLSVLLARWAVKVDPDPPLVFTTRKFRDIHVDQDLVNW